MTAIVSSSIGSSPTIRTPMLPFLQGMHVQWLQEVRSVVDPARGEAPTIWLRWRAVDYLETGFKRRFERERRAVYSLHARVTGPQASHLWAAGELVLLLIENMRHHLGLCHHVKEFSALTVTLMTALEHWCAEVEESLGPVRWGEVPVASRVLFETITYDEVTLGA